MFLTIGVPVRVPIPLKLTRLSFVLGDRSNDRLYLDEIKYYDVRIYFSHFTLLILTSP